VAAKYIATCKTVDFVKQLSVCHPVLLPVQADRKLLARKGGFLGSLGGCRLRGSKCRIPRPSSTRMSFETDGFIHLSISICRICYCPAQADRKLLAPKGGFLGGLGERGIGGSKCGATAAVALLYTGKDGGAKLLAANVGDARVLLNRGGKIVQLTEDHVPDRCV
jgi:hypothetical protein